MDLTIPISPEVEQRLRQAADDESLSVSAYVSRLIQQSFSKSETEATPTQKVQSKADVIARLESCRSELESLGVSKCGLFGSFVRDVDVKEESDVDVLISFELGKKTFDNFMTLSFRLEELFGRSVDLVTTESLSPHIGPHILKEVEYVFVA